MSSTDRTLQPAGLLASVPSLVLMDPVNPTLAAAAKHSVADMMPSVLDRYKQGTWTCMAAKQKQSIGRLVGW